MTAQQQQEAVEWFIDRFIQEQHGRAYARIKHGITPRQERIHPRVHKHNRMYDFIAQPHPEAPNQLYILPLQPASAWVSGVIFIDANGEYQFRSNTPSKLV